MAVHLRRTLVPGVSAASFRHLLARVLKERRYTIEGHTTRSGAEHARAVPRHRALAWYQVTLPPAVPVVVIDEVAGGEAEAWDAGVGQALSDHTGGFVAAMESQRSRDLYSFALCWAGRVFDWMRGSPDIEGAPLIREDAVTSAWDASVRALTGVSPAQLMWQPDTVLEVVECSAPFVPLSPDPPEDGRGPFCRAAIAYVSPDELGETLETSRGWRIHHAKTPDLGITYTLIESSRFEDFEALGDVTQRTDKIGLVVGVPDESPRFVWAAWDGAPSTGQGAGGRELIATWERFSVYVSTPPGALLLPRD